MKRTRFASLIARAISWLMVARSPIDVQQLSLDAGSDMEPVQIAGAAG